MKKIVVSLGLFLFLGFVRVLLTILGIFELFWNWFAVSDSGVWIRRLQRCGVVVLSSFFAMFGVHMMFQSSNASDSATIVVVIFTGILIMVLSIMMLVKFMPRKPESPSYYFPYR